VALRIEKVDWFDPRAVALREAMSVETGDIYARLYDALPPADQTAMDLALAVDPADILDTVIALDGEEVVGHAAIRPFGDALEVKKVFVPVHQRGRGISRLLMDDLEQRARARGVASLVLQTGSLQHAAIALYEKIGYVPMPVYGAYTAIPFAVCFEKSL
jgi:GNAT superfamily N-acetyltransferase